MKNNDIETRVQAIEARNAKVEMDKAWETSWVRRVTVAGLIYIIIAVFLLSIHKPQPFINAFVPPIGYLMSTLVLREVREFWETKIKLALRKK